MKDETITETFARLGLTLKTEPTEATEERDDSFDRRHVSARLGRNQTLFRDSQIPYRHRHTPTLHGEGWNKALTLVSTHKGGLWVVHGPPGTGKTQMGVEAVRACCAEGQPALWTTAADMLLTLRACFRADSKRDEIETLNDFTSKKLLVIDEFHRRKGSDWDQQVIFQIVDRMYFKMHRLIVITNQTEAEFEASTDIAMTSRIREVGGFVHCNWGTFRVPLDKIKNAK